MQRFVSFITLALIAVALIEGSTGFADSRTLRPIRGSFRTVQNFDSGRSIPTDHHPANVRGLRRESVGTGFFITANRVLTNFHVAGDCKALTVGNNREGEETEARFEAGNPALDLAILIAEAKDVVPVQFAHSLENETGTDLTIIGYPEHGLPVLEAELDLVSADRADLLAERYPFFGAVRRGNSGSPVLNSTGLIVGVVSAKINTVAVYRRTGVVVDDIGFAIANQTILDFLRVNNIPFQTATSGTTLTSDQLLAYAHNFVRQIGCWK